MPQEIVVTLKQAEGGFWPFVRDTFALIGFGAVVVGAVIVNSPNPQGKAVHLIEAVGEGWRASEAGYRAKANPYDGIIPDPLPDVPALPDNPTGKQESYDVD
jgi:hypothetical protein